MRLIVDITGLTFGRLTVLAPSGIGSSRRAMFLCKCSCGNERVLAGIELRKGNVQSCGCLRQEHAQAVAQANIIHGHARRLEPLSRTLTSWKCMKQRCQNPQATGFDDYGEKGVRVCDRWQTFEGFLADMGERPPHMTLGRFRDVGDYTPSNCRWMTLREQKLESFKKKHNIQIERWSTPEGALWEITKACYTEVEVPSKIIFDNAVKSGEVFVIRAQEKFIGYAIIINQNTRTPLLLSIAVLPRFRKLGLGKELLDRLSGYYRNKQAVTLVLECRIDNRAQKLYFDAGYRIREVLKGHYAPEGDGLRMVKTL